MTTDAYLWAIFALLFLALVLVVVTARRGPWDRMKPCVPVQCPDQEEVVIEGIYTVIEFEPGVVERSQARWEAVFPTGVDPLWGKNRPPVRRPTVADLMKDEW